MQHSFACLARRICSKSSENKVKIRADKARFKILIQNDRSELTLFCTCMESPERGSSTTLGSPKSCEVQECV